MMSVQAERLQDLRKPEVATTTPFVPTATYHDGYGNLCRRLVAPAGETVLRADATIRDDGEPDLVFPSANESPVELLPNEILPYLRGSRYCETDRLRIRLVRSCSGTPLGWPRVQAICDFVHDHMRFDYRQARPTRAPTRPTREGKASAATSLTSRSRFAGA